MQIILSALIVVLSVAAMASPAAAQAGGTPPAAQAGSAPPAPAPADAVSAVPPDATVVYVSSQRLTTETTQGKEGLTRIQTFQRDRNEQLRVRAQTLEATRRELAAATDPAERSRLQIQEQQQQADLVRAQQEAQRELQELQREIQNQLRPVVQKILAELLKGTKVEIVLPLETAVVWAKPGRDVTSAVIERMNRAAGS